MLRDSLKFSYRLFCCEKRICDNIFNAIQRRQAEEEVSKTLAECGITIISSYRYNFDNLVSITAYLVPGYNHFNFDEVHSRGRYLSRKNLNVECKRVGIIIDDSVEIEEVDRICEIFRRAEELTEKLKIIVDSKLNKIGLLIRNNFDEDSFYRKISMLNYLSSVVLFGWPFFSTPKAKDISKEFRKI
jgi:hypothetical protein